mmetsp:Transcript_17178/g.19241  ORF Transcript_17178/g.19241 Transcript_17178/m.19241 type:complete len:271 (+) Transcript_17178:414-1226(+)
MFNKLSIEVSKFPKSFSMDESELFPSLFELNNLSIDKSEPCPLFIVDIDDDVVPDAPSPNDAPPIILQPPKDAIERESLLQKCAGLVFLLPIVVGFDRVMSSKFRSVCNSSPIFPNLEEIPIFEPSPCDPGDENNLSNNIVDMLLLLLLLLLSILILVLVLILPAMPASERMLPSLLLLSFRAMVGVSKSFDIIASKSISILSNTSSSNNAIDWAPIVVVDVAAPNRSEESGLLIIMLLFMEFASSVPIIIFELVVFFFLCCSPAGICIW